jgi:uncharacterized cupredoxin-like copper-binding protein
MSVPRRRWVVVAAGVALAAVGASLVLGLTASSGASADDPPAPIGPGTVTVRVVVEDSRFIPARIHVVAHTEVRFEIVNRDIINHEFIVGDDDVHARHEEGHEPWHAAVPGEVSVAPHETGVTTYVFHEPGTVVFACHLPGHLAFGMKGVVVVEPPRLG